MANEYQANTVALEVLASHPTDARVNVIAMEVLRTQAGATPSAGRRRQGRMGGF